MYYRNAQAAVVVYDVTKSVSLPVDSFYSDPTDNSIDDRLLSNKPRLGSKNCNDKLTPSEFSSFSFRKFDGQLIFIHFEQHRHRTRW
jgi:hypothetical protein